VGQDNFKYQTLVYYLTFTADVICSISARFLESTVIQLELIQRRTVWDKMYWNYETASLDSPWIYRVTLNEKSHQFIFLLRF